MSSDTIAIVGAFLSGIGAVVGSALTLKRIRQSDRRDCEQRIRELRESYERGMDLGLRIEKREAP